MMPASRAGGPGFRGNPPKNPGGPTIPASIYVLTQISGGRAALCGGLALLLALKECQVDGEAQQDEARGLHAASRRPRRQKTIPPCLTLLKKPVARVQIPAGPSVKKPGLDYLPVLYLYSDVEVDGIIAVGPASVYFFPGGGLAKHVVYVRGVVIL